MLGLSLALTSPVVLRRATSPLAIILSWPEIIVLWHAAHGVSLSGTQTTGWAERKHGFAAVQEMASRRQVFSTDGFGGTAGIAYDGADDYLACADPDLLAMLPVGNEPCEIWTLGLVLQCLSESREFERTSEQFCHDVVPDNVLPAENAFCPSTIDMKHKFITLRTSCIYSVIADVVSQSTNSVKK